MNHGFFSPNLLRSLYNLKLIYVIIWVKVTVGFIKSNYICLVDSNIVIYYLQLSTLEIGWWIFEWRSYSFRGSTPPNRIRLWPKLCNLWSWSRKKDTSWCIPPKNNIFSQSILSQLRGNCFLQWWFFSTKSRYHQPLRGIFSEKCVAFCCWDATRGSPVGMWGSYDGNIYPLELSGAALNLVGPRFSERIG